MATSIALTVFLLQAPLQGRYLCGYLFADVLDTPGDPLRQRKRRRSGSRGPALGLLFAQRLGEIGGPAPWCEPPRHSAV